MYKEIEGNLITMAKNGDFDVIVHAVNCFCKMGAGLAPQMVRAFGCDRFPIELETPGNINKLGQIDFKRIVLSARLSPLKSFLYVVNAYTQYNYGRNHIDGDKVPFNYYAFILCMQKINHIFKGQHIGLPEIGCGLGGANWIKVRTIIQNELKDMDVTIVHYKS